MHFEISRQKIVRKHSKSNNDTMKTFYQPLLLYRAWDKPFTKKCQNTIFENATCSTKNRFHKTLTVEKSFGGHSKIEDLSMKNKKFTTLLRLKNSSKIVWYTIFNRNRIENKDSSFYTIHDVLISNKNSSIEN